MQGRSIIPILVIIFCICLVFTGGCIKKVQDTIEPPSATPEIPAPSSSPTTPVPAATIVPEISVVEPEPVLTAVVQEADPVLTPDPYPVIHGTQFNQTLTTNPIINGPYEFEKKYTLTGNAVGLTVNVTKGPLYIIYDVTPKNDCLKDPTSCRGDKTRSINRPYLTITVRDNITREIIAEDGYGREFSSDTGKATYSNTGKNTADSLLSSASYEEVTTTSTPGPRYIKIYRDGVFHITLEGSFLDVDMRIKTGATPADSAPATSSSNAEPESNEEFF